jgi:hypothetical protein
VVRVALLSLVERTERQPDGARGDLLVGGRPLIGHQLAQALALGCRRIAILVDQSIADIATLRAAAERVSAQLYTIGSSIDLVPLVTPADELIVLADGLFASPDAVLTLLAQEHGVLCFPIEEGLAAGFERIDINRAYAGAMHLPGRLVSRLADLPGEWSVPSALMRLAVQAGVPLRSAPAQLLAVGGWRLLANEVDAHHAEEDWVRMHVPAGEISMPGAWLANLGVRTLGPTLLHAGTRPALIGIGAGMISLLGVGAGWFGATSIGLVLVGLAWLVARATDLLAEIERAALIRPAVRFRTDGLLDWFFDALFVLICAWRIEDRANPVLAAALFAPLVLFGLLRLVPRIAARRWRLSWLADRLVAAFVLAVASVALPFGAAVSLIVLLLLGVALMVTAASDPSSPNPPLTNGG